MTLIDVPAQFRPYAAPRKHGHALIDPAWSDLAALPAANRALAQQWDCDLIGIDIQDLRAQAKHQLLSAAIAYTSSYRAVPDRWRRLVDGGSAAAELPLSDIPFLVAGHQPELFHPGVWFKNLALAHLAAQQPAVAINLIVDNDLCGAPAVRVPSRQAGQLTRVAVPYDRPSAQQVPFEQRWISERTVFDTFAKRVREQLSGVVADPCVAELWPAAIAAADGCGNIGCALAQARHLLEAQIGWQTLEVPISAVAQSDAFAAFCLALMLDAPRLHNCYNHSLQIYRRAHKIRSNAHPVPSLKEEEGWFEAPLWIYGDDNPLRRPAWVRLIGDTLEIGDRGESLIRVAANHPQRALTQLREQSQANFKLRPRALVTTMFARLLLSDLFLHGIGGAKYDQLGDMIVRQFFAIEPPAYGVLSATVLLPTNGAEPTAPAVAEVQADLRDTQYAPERFANVVELPRQLVDEKRAMLASVPPRGEKASWHRRIATINRELATHLEEHRQWLYSQLEVAKQQQREAKIWTSREHPFPVYPLEHLTNTFDHILANAATRMQT